MILAALLHAILVWLAALVATNADAHPVPDPLPHVVTHGPRVPTPGHQPPPAPTPAPDPLTYAGPYAPPATDSPMCSPPLVVVDCWPGE